MVSDMRVTRNIILIVLMRILSVVVSIVAVDEILVVSFLASSDIKTVIVIQWNVLLFI
jgi:hypothetical protein